MEGGSAVEDDPENKETSGLEIAVDFGLEIKKRQRIFLFPKKNIKHNNNKFRTENDFKMFQLFGTVKLKPEK